MKKLMSIITVLLLITTMAMGQQSGKTKKEAAEKKAAAERQRSLGGQRTNNDAKGAPSPQADSATAKENQRQQPASKAGEVVPSNTDQSIDNSNEQKSNAPAVVQRTSSESGSPAIRSGNDGRERDGTNNVQRSTPNMAGATVPPGMKLYGRNGSEKNTNNDSLKIRRQEEMPQRSLSKGTEATGKDRVKGGQPNKKEAGEKKRSKKKRGRDKDQNSGK